MAKTGTPISDPILSPLLAQITNLRNTSGVATTRLLPPPTASQLAAIENAQLYNAASRASWDTLAGWKKYRWAVCAWRRGIPTDPATGYTGWSGFALYSRCWHDQQTPIGHQPISPCSRRATDPMADPWDYTP